MKRLFKLAAISIMSLGLTATVLPAQTPYYDGRGGNPYQAASYHDDSHYAQPDRDYGRYDRHDNYRDDRYDRGDRYDRYDRHDGRRVAIVAGGAAAGALIGAAAGHGQGAVVGAVVGGIAGLVASHAVHH